MHLKIVVEQPPAKYASQNIIIENAGAGPETMAKTAAIAPKIGPSPAMFRKLDEEKFAMAGKGIKSTFIPVIL